MGFQFQYNIFIWLLALVPFFIGLYLLYLQWKRRVRSKMGDPKLVRSLSENFSPRFALVKFAMLCVAFSVGVIAAMNPRTPGGEDNVTRKGIDLVVALDVSKSMLAADLAPNRLERARQFILKLMDALPDDRIGLVLFAGKAYLQMPLTIDHGAAALFVSSAAPDAVPQQGTVLGDALNMSMNAFVKREGRFKSIVLISDGEEHDAQGVKTAGELAEQGVMINTVGVGSPEGATIIDPATGQNKTDEAGNTVVSKLNEQSLKEIAEKTNGIYVRLQSSDEAVAAMKKQLSQIESKVYSDVSLINFNTFFMWFAAIMFGLLIIEQLFPERRRMKKTRLKIAALIPVLVFTANVHAQTADELIQTGNAAYRKQQFEDAEKSYKAALKADPTSTTAKFNLTAATYREGQLQQAVTGFDEIAMKESAPATRAEAFYNKGAVLSKDNKLEQSIEAYKNALRQNPNDKDARENLQKALLELKKKQPPPKKEDDKKKKQDQQQQKQQQPKLNQREAEQRLKLLDQKEKEVQQRLQKEKSKTGGGQAKDW